MKNILFLLLFYFSFHAKTIEQKYTFSSKSTRVFSFGTSFILLRFYYMLQALLRDVERRAILNMNNHSVNV